MTRLRLSLAAALLLFALSPAKLLAEHESTATRISQPFTDVPPQPSNQTIETESTRKSSRATMMLEISRNGGIENYNNKHSSLMAVATATAAAAARVENIEARRSATMDPDDLEPREEDLLEAVDFGIRAMNDLYTVKEPKLYAMGLYLSADNPARFVAAFNGQSEEAKQLAKFGYATLEAATKFRSKFPDTLRQASRRPNTRRSPLRQQCPKKGIPQCPAASLRYRTSDGSCNNLKELWWGSAMSPMQRFLPAVYEDNIQSIRRSVTGSELPSARIVSDSVHKERDIPLTSVTHMLMQWGQFIDHDITATAQSRAFNGSVPQCCLSSGEGFQPPEFLHPECLPIAVHPQDSHLGKLGIRCMEFVRSGPVPREDCELGSREQLSQVTSFIDASTVYSSSPRQSDSLRIFRNGLLQYGKLQSRRPVLPREEDPDLCLLGSLSTKCFKAGDPRLSEQPALISLHVVFLRLHNRLATKMAALNQHWGDEKIFQETRRIVAAIVQHVTYREFLPIVLGPEVMKIFDIELLRKGFYQGYDETVNPSVANAFATAAYRFGHSLVQPSFVRFDSNHKPIFNNVTIHEEFKNEVNLESARSVDRLLLGLINQPAQKRDEFISSELTNHLFQTPGFPFGMDLASLNIQRGRDHGIPPYVDWRVACSLSPVRDWSDLEHVLASSETAQKFRKLYATVEDVDLFSAGLSEKPVAGGLVGPTFACIIAQQFRNLRKGDRFWYENPFLENGFTPDQLQQIRRVTLAQILCSTTDSIETIQPFVMLTADQLRNRRLPCTNPLLDQINLAPWIERPRRRRSTLEDPNVEEEMTTMVEDEQSEEQESRAAATGTKKRTSQRSPPRQKPTKTRINQNNRIAVRRPLGPHENLTIVVNNHAVIAPVIVSDSIYNSNVQINNFPPDSRPGKPSNGQFENNYGSSATLPNPYYPHNFQDPNNPNPPSYGLSPKPMNDFFPNNEFFTYTSRPPVGPQGQLNDNQQYSYLTTQRPSTLQPQGQDYVTSNQQGYLFSTNNPKPTTKRPYPDYDQPSNPRPTTKRPYPDYDQPSNYSPLSDAANNPNGNRPSNNDYSSSSANNQQGYGNLESNNSNRDNNQASSINNIRPTKKPNQSYPNMSNRRYPEPKPQHSSHSNNVGSDRKPSPTIHTSKRPQQTNYRQPISTTIRSHTTKRPTASTMTRSSYLSSTFESSSTIGAYDTEKKKYNNTNSGAPEIAPQYLHTHTSISDVQYVLTPEKPTQKPLQQSSVADIELPKPLFSLSLENRENSDGWLVEKSMDKKNAEVLTNEEEPIELEPEVREVMGQLMHVTAVGDETNGTEDNKSTTVESLLERNANRIINDTPMLHSIEPLEMIMENDTLDTFISYELPRPIVKHES